jgi:hypothetical protein
MNTEKPRKADADRRSPDIFSVAFDVSNAVIFDGELEGLERTA